MLSQSWRVCKRPVAIIRPAMQRALPPRLLQVLRPIALTMFLVSLVAGCASPATRNPADPLEPMNRAIFKFNDVADRVALKPIAKVYDAVLPQFVRTGARNFFSNLDDVVVVANDLLQLKFTEAAQDTTRLVGNTVFGVFGLIDIASMSGIPKRNEDFGQTLGYWGLGPGPYLVLPFLGPSTVRDGSGRLVDAYIDPVWYISDVPVRNTTVGIRLVDARASLFPAERLLEQAAVDKYAFLRDAYLARRINLIYDGNPPRKRDEFEEELFEDDEDMQGAPDRDLPGIVPPVPPPALPGLPGLR